MPREYIHVDRANVSWSYAVARVAEAMNPLGAAARIVAEISACVVEIRQLDVERLRLNSHRALALDAIHHRQEIVAGLFDARRQDTHGIHVTLGSLRDGFNAAVGLMIDRFISEDERMLAHGTVQTLTVGITQLHAQESSSLIQLGRTLLLKEPIATIARWQIGR